LKNLAADGICSIGPVRLQSSLEFWENTDWSRKSQGSGKKAHMGLEGVERPLGGGPRPGHLRGITFYYTITRDVLSIGF